MGFFKRLFGLSESKQPNVPCHIPTHRWHEHIFVGIDNTISNSGLRELPQMAAYVDKRDNYARLCAGQNGALPNMTNNPDVLVYCYLKDVSTFVKISEVIGKILESTEKQAQILKECGLALDASRLQTDTASLEPMIDQIAFHVATELVRKLEQLDEFKNV